MSGEYVAWWNRFDQRSNRQRLKETAVLEIGMIGLGRMGGNMAQRLLMAGHQVHAFDQNANALDSSVALGASGAKSVADLVSQFGAATRGLAHVAGRRCHRIMYERPGRIAVGRGRHHRRWQRELSGKHCAGGRCCRSVASNCSTRGPAVVSGGLTEGYSLMVGGDEDAFRRLEPIFQAWPREPDRGYSRVARPAPVISPRWFTTAWNTV